MIRPAATLFALIAFPLGAAAQTVPQLSGTYLVHVTSFCGMPVAPWPNGVTSGFDGSYESSIGRATFNAATHTVSVVAITGNTQIIVPNSTAGVAAIKNSSFNSKYSNTAGALALGGRTYRIVYGGVVGTIAQSFLFMTLIAPGNGITGNDCISTGSATLIPA